jgi:hypothetical protein
MNRSDLRELHYITTISNVASIITHGILSHKSAAKVRHTSIAMEEVQERRKKKIVPGGRPLHDYVNLYICARNPMLYVRLSEHQNLCVVQIHPDILDEPGVIITDCNAASDYARFAQAPQGLSIVDKDLTFAEYWTHPDPVLVQRELDFWPI